MARSSASSWIARALGLGAAAWVVSAQEAPVIRSTLDSIEAVKRMSRSLAGRRLPVHVRGTVTYVNPFTAELFLQSGDEAISLWHPDPEIPLERGDIVELDGDTDAGRFAPKILPDARSMRVTRGGSLPEPVDLTRELVSNMRHDCRFVRAQGVGRRVDWQDGELIVVFDGAIGLVQVRVPARERPPALPQHWVGAVLRVTGVVVTELGEGGRMTGFRIYAQEEGDVGIVQGTTRAEFLPEKSLGDLLTFDPLSLLNGRVRTRGVVTLQRGDGSFFIQDGRAGALVTPADPVTVAPGEEISLAGFPVAREQLVRCEDAVLLTRGPGAAPAPVALLRQEELLDPSTDERLIQTEGTFLEFGERNGESILYIQLDAGGFAEARLRAEQRPFLPAEILRGARVRLTGVKAAFLSSLLGSRWTVLLMRGPADLVVVARTPFWTRERALALAGSFAALLAAVVLFSRWRNVRLRRERDRLETCVAERTRDLSSLNESLLELAREKSEFLAIAAHDLRSPLTVITGYASLLEANAGGDPHRVAAEIGAAAMRMERMIEHFLDAQAAQAGHHTPHLASLDLREMALKGVELSRATYARKIQTLELEAPASPVRVNADRVLLDQVVANLLDNASKFSPRASVVRLIVRGPADGKSARLEVADRGPGLTADDQQKLFQRYTRLSARPTAGEPSCGLGLALVKAWVEMMGGSIGCDSRPGEGACFWVELPAA